ncbi:MAG: phosphotransferase enzyme family protein [Anaerolineae bacterium]|jgi:Ser/Thr protein kinase RdoA (MazF antagonist)
MDETQARFDQLAGQALAAYELASHTRTFIRHSDNATFKVEGPGAGTYLLRIHLPVSAAMGAQGADLDMVRSELLWLEALSRDTDLVLQAPVRNRDGALVTQLPAEDGAPPVNCTLMRWVEGQPYHRDLESEATARQIGRILATLHNHASRWEMPPGFTRPRRDVAYFEDALATVRLARDDGRITAADYDELARSIELLTGMLRSEEGSRQTNGIMHADTHKGNMLYHNGEVRLIDFSFCAFGNYLFDLGICLCDMKPELHAACLDSYRRLRPLPANCEQWIEGLWVGSMVGTFSYWVANPNAQELLARKVPEIVRDHTARFNRGERFWFV